LSANATTVIDVGQSASIVAPARRSRAVSAADSIAASIGTTQGLGLPPRGTRGAGADAGVTPAIATPKLAAQVAGLGYHYYAGFSPDFVGDVLNHVGATTDDVVIDPWNGSGTTTLVCAGRGLRSSGFDLSPAMVVVAKGRLYRASAEVVARRIEHIVAATPPRRRPRVGEPLRAWFDESSAARLRWFTERLSGQTGKIDPNEMSPESCFLTTALFLAIRSFMGAAMTSNPTWIRKELNEGDRARATWKEFVARFAQAALEIEHPTADIKAWPNLRVADTSATLIRTDVGGAAESSSAARSSADTSVTATATSPRPTVLITSPPYCTRIDYVASTRPELAALGWTASDQELLRRRMLGTTTVANKLARTEGFGAEAESLLAKVTSHESRASATYYRKWLGQYLDTYQRSIQVLAATLAPGGRAAIVVQDSFYKDVHIDLARITHEMCEAAGWRHESTIAFFVPRTMASINPRSRPYRERATVTESLLLFRAP